MHIALTTLAAISFGFSIIAYIYVVVEAKRLRKARKDYEELYEAEMENYLSSEQLILDILKTASKKEH